MISSFDDRLDGLRKAGFSLVATLLTAEGLLLPGDVGSTSSLPDAAKFAVLLATLLLVTGMEIVDRIYRGFQGAAATRAIVLEHKLNLELTEIVASRFPASKVAWGVFGAYFTMGFAVLVLGSVVLDPNVFFWFLVAIFVLWAGLTHSIQVGYGEHGPVDWSLSSQELAQDQPLQVMVTNLAPEIRLDRGDGARNRRRPETLDWNVNEVAWRFELEGLTADEVPGTTSLIHEVPARVAISLLPQQDYVWQLRAEELPVRFGDGVYQVRPMERLKDGKLRPWPDPLRRKIILSREAKSRGRQRPNARIEHYAEVDT